MTKDEVKVLVDDITGIHIDKDGVDIHIVNLVDELRSCERRQIFLDFNVDVDARDMLISQLMDTDLMDSLMKQMATYRVKDTDTYFVFPGMIYTPTDKPNRFKCRIMLMCPTEEEPVEDEYTELTK